NDIHDHQNDILNDVTLAILKRRPFKSSKSENDEEDYISLCESAIDENSDGEIYTNNVIDGSKKKKLEFCISSALHSFILDVEDEVVLNHFTEEEMEEIVQVSGPAVPELSENVIDCLSDWILRSTGKGDNDEFGVGEAGHSWKDKYGTKFLKESGTKLPKNLKDMIMKLMEKVKWNPAKYNEIQTVGIIHAGHNQIVGPNSDWLLLIVYQIIGGGSTQKLGNMKTADSDSGSEQNYSNDSSSEKETEIKKIGPTKRTNPRFDDLSGKFNEDLFEKSYNFLNEYKRSEIEEVKKRIDKEKDPEEKQKLQQLLNKLVFEQSRAAHESNLNRKKQLKRERKKKERELVAQGKSPFYIKKCNIILERLNSFTILNAVKDDLNR
ncbi:16043_t:CDS:2, partial [Racocetra fulgida]